MATSKADADFNFGIAKELKGDVIKSARRTAGPFGAMYFIGGGFKNVKATLGALTAGPGDVPFKIQH